MAVLKQVKPPGNPFVARLASGQLPIFNGSPVSGAQLNTDTGAGTEPTYRGNLVGKPGPGKVAVIDRVMVSFRVSASTVLTTGLVGLRINRLNSGGLWQACDLPFVTGGTALPANAEVTYDLPNFGLALDGDAGTALVGNVGERLGAWSFGTVTDIRTSITAFGRILSRSEAIASGDLRFGTAGAAAPNTGGWSSFVDNGAAGGVVFAPAVVGHFHVIRTLCMTGTSDPGNFDATRNVWVGTDVTAAIDAVEPIQRLWNQTRLADPHRIIITGGNIVLPVNQEINVRAHVAANAGGGAVFCGWETLPAALLKDQDQGFGGALV